MGSRLYVGNIPFNTDETQLRTFFEEGNRQVASVKIIMDRETGRPRGFAFVDMATDEEAQGAITAFHGKEFGGRTLTVNEARERQPGERPGGFERAPRTGGYQGGGGGDRGGYQGGGDNRGPDTRGGGYQGGGDNRGPDNRGGYQGGGDNRGPDTRGGGYQGNSPRPGYQGGDNRGSGGGYQGGAPPTGDDRGNRGGYPSGGDDRGNRGGYQGGDNRGGGGGYQGGGDRGGFGGPPGGNRGGFDAPPGADDRGNRTRDYEKKNQNKNRGGAAYERDRGRRNFDDDDEAY